MTVSIQQAQLKLVELIARSSRGEEITIANEVGNVVARIVPEVSASWERVSVLEQVERLSPRQYTPGQWEEIERDFQEERDAWDH